MLVHNIEKAFVNDSVFNLKKRERVHCRSLTLSLLYVLLIRYRCPSGFGAQWNPTLFKQSVQEGIDKRSSKSHKKKQYIDSFWKV